MFAFIINLPKYLLSTHGDLQRDSFYHSLTLNDDVKFVLSSFPAFQRDMRLLCESASSGSFLCPACCGNLSQLSALLTDGVQQKIGRALASRKLSADFNV